MKTEQNPSLEYLKSQNLFLMSEIASFRTENTAFRNENLLLKNQLAELKEQLEWFKKQIFGKKSEKITSDLNSYQPMFDGFENEPTDMQEKKLIPAHVRAKPNRNGQDKIDFPSDLPKETTILDIPEEQKTVDGKLLVKIGEEVTQKLAHKPGEYYIKEIIRPKYALPNEGVLTTDLPDSIIPRCRVDESFIAEMLVQKFCNHLPLYRISEILERRGIFISRKLMSQWVVRVGLILKPLCDTMLKEILTSGNIFVDETPVRFIEGESRLGYLWTICGGNSSDPSYRVYNFRENRCYDNIFDILKDYRGVLHSDKYGGYQKLAEEKKIIWTPCWAHIRRKFFEAEAGDPPFRAWVLEQIHLLFVLEEEAWKLSPDERVRIRLEKEGPIIDGLIQRIKGRLIEGNVLPKSKFREALGYFCGLIPYIKNYLNYPFARLDNNVAERSIRPIAIGRKNWLFFGSLDGGMAGSAILSLVQTCRGLGINPREYLEDVLRRFMGHSSQRLSELLPDQWLLGKQKSI